jgi:LPS export ABC transporter protein LptC
MKVRIGRKQRKLKLFLLFAIVVSFGIIFAVFLNYRHQTEIDDSFASPIPEDANIAIGKVHQTATRDGATEWSMDAGSVTYFDADKKALFEDISVTFYLKDGSHIDMTADKGVLHTESQDIEVTGNIVVKNMEYRLQTEILDYNHKQRMIYSKTPVRISGESFKMVADSMSIDLKRNQAGFKGNIKGSINEK